MSLNKDAIVCWLYIREACTECQFEAVRDPNFVRLVIDMTQNYWSEFEAMDNVTHVQRWLEEKKDD